MMQVACENVINSIPYIALDRSSANLLPIRHRYRVDFSESSIVDKNKN